jgi:hypothetical protein
MHVLRFFVSILILALPAAAVCPTTVELGERLIPSTVTVLADGDGGQTIGSGSGFFVDSDLVVTNWHVVSASRSLRIKLTTSEKTYPITGIVGADLANDLAVLRVAPPVTGRPVTLVETVPKRGAKVFAFGSPHLLEATMSDGIVSAEREIEGAPRIQITAAVSPGSSGGPVTDECGGVIGVAYMKVRDAEALNFVIPTRFVQAALRHLEEPHGAEYWRQHGQAALQKVTAERLGVPEGIDPDQWVQIDVVAQRFHVGLDRRTLDGVAFFRHVGRIDLVKEANNVVPLLFYVSAGACGALSLCGCALAVPLTPLGVGFGVGVLGGLGLCASATSAGAGFLLWQDGVAPDMSFAEREAMARAHNEGLSRLRPSKKTHRNGEATTPSDTAPTTPAPPPLEPSSSDDDSAPRDPAGDEPAPAGTTTPPLDRPAGTSRGVVW